MNELGAKQSRLAGQMSNLLGGKMTVGRFRNRQPYWSKDLYFDILTVHGGILADTITSSTLGLSGYQIKDHEKGRPPVRSELLAAIRNDTDFEMLTGDAADGNNFLEKNLLYMSSYMVGETWYCTAGTLWVNYFSNQYDTFSTVEHLLFTSPSFFMKVPDTINFEGHLIQWLLCVPITGPELALAEKRGVDALEQLLIREKVDFTDLFRASLV
jgi:hypothetical protein